MNKFGVLKAAFIVGLTVICGAGLAACNSNDQEGATSQSAHSSGVAATVNGVEIAEDTITNYIQNFRASYGMTDDDSWGSYLAMFGQTPEGIREDVINSYASEELIKEAAAEQGITIDDDVVQGYVDTMAAHYSSDEAWQEALSKAGLTEDAYRDEIRTRLQTNEFMETFDDIEDPTDEELLEYGERYASSYDGAKRSSMILFTADDQATGQEVADKIAAGELDFDTAVTQYSADSASAANGGDQGWDMLTYPGSDYQAALDALEVDQVSGLIETSLGFQIIKCTDIFEAPKTTDEDGNEVIELTSIDQLPEEWISDITQSVKDEKQNEAYQTWSENALETADIVINPMPADVPYNVDMSQYVTDDEEDATDEPTDEPVDETLTEDITIEGEETPDGEEAEVVEAEGEITPESADADEETQDSETDTANEDASSEEETADEEPAE